MTEEEIKHLYEQTFNLRENIYLLGLSRKNCSEKEYACLSEISKKAWCSTSGATGLHPEKIENLLECN